MGRFLTVQALLLLATTVTAASVIRTQRREEAITRTQIRACLNAADNCFERNLSPLVINASFHQVMADRALLTDIAAALAVTEHCVENVHSSLGCNTWGVEQRLNTVRFYAGYFQRPDAIDEVIGLSTSVCFSNWSKAEEFEGASTACLNSFEAAIVDVEGADTCGRLSQLLFCLTEATTRICGASAGSFAASVRDYLITPPGDMDVMAGLSAVAYIDFTSCGDRLVLERPLLNTTV